MSFLLRAFGICLICVPLGFTYTAAQTTTYYYQGAPFNEASGSFSTAFSVTGSFTLGAPLAPNLEATDLREEVLSCVFSDGVQRRTCADSDISSFGVWTDGDGNIRLWDIRLTSIPIATQLGEMNDVVGTWGYEGITDGGTPVSGVNDFAALDVPCTFIPGDRCWAWGSSPDFGSSTLTGIGWTASPEAGARQFPTVVSGGGSSTEVFFFADSTVSHAAVFADLFSADGTFIERRTARVGGGQVGSFSFGGTDGLSVGHIDIIAPRLISVTEIVRLKIPGAPDVPPIGLDAAGPCSRLTALLLRDSQLNTGLALANGAADPVSCQYRIFMGADGTIGEEGQIELQAFSQQQAFPLAALGDGQFSIEVDCDAPIFGLSLFQDRSTGALLSNAIQCRDR